MRNRYFFDKRDLKKFFLKYGIMILIAIPILIGVDLAIAKNHPDQSFVLIDLALLCGVVGLGELICFWIKSAKEKKNNKE